MGNVRDANKINDISALTYEVPVSNASGSSTPVAAPYEVPISKQSNKTSARPYEISTLSTNRNKLAALYEVPISSGKTSVLSDENENMVEPYEVHVLQKKTF